MFQTKVVKKIKTHSVLNIFILSKIMPFMSWCGKYSTAGQATDDSMARAHCM